MRAHVVSRAELRRRRPRARPGRAARCARRPVGAPSRRGRAGCVGHGAGRAGRGRRSAPASSSTGLERRGRRGRGGVRRAGRLRARRARRSQDRAAGGAGTSGAVCNLCRWSRQPAPTTTVASRRVALVEGAELGRGSGASKKASEQEAAREALRADRPGRGQVTIGSAMYLKAVRMRGFKSFAQNVELGFDQGIAVVVGPNGSGKSNIADALQWAMAVQSPAQLRAPTGQDVLFGGIRRAPAGRRLRGRAGARQRVRHAADRVQRGVGDAAALPRRRERVLPEPGQGAAAGRAGAPVRHRPRPRDALRDRPGQGRGDPAVQAPRAPAVRRGGGGAGQVPAPPHPGRGQAGPRRGGAGARPRPRARGARPAAAAGDAGHGRRAGGEAGRRDRAGADRAAVVGAAGRAGAGRRPARPAGRRRGRQTEVEQAAAAIAARRDSGASASWPGCRPSRSGRHAPSTPTSRRASGSWPRPGGWRHRWRGWSAAPGGAGSRPRSCAGWRRAHRTTPSRGRCERRRARVRGGRHRRRATCRRPRTPPRRPRRRCPARWARGAPTPTPRARRPTSAASWRRRPPGPRS